MERISLSMSQKKLADLYNMY